MTVQMDIQHDIVPSRSDKADVATDSAPVALNLCGNALEFAQAVHSAYIADVAIDAHTWDAPAAPIVSQGKVDPAPATLAAKARRDKELIWG